MKNLLLALLLCIPLALAAGCSDDDAASPAVAGEGRLSIDLVDAPAAYDAVDVEIVGVSAHRADEDSLAGWFEVAIADTVRVDLLSLTGGAAAVLADTVLPAGRYTQVRLLLGADNRVTFDGVEHPLEVPSGMSSGLKIQFPFTIEPGTLYEMTLDFDAARSIHTTGNGRWIMRPVIRAAAKAVSGSISGAVTPVDALALVTAASAVDTAATYADPETGAFALMALPEGEYDLSVQPTAGAYSDTLLTGVEVTALQDTDVGVIELEPVVEEPPAE